MDYGVKVDGDGDGEMKNIKNKYGLFPTMAVLFWRRMKDLLIKVLRNSLVGFDKARGVLMADVGYQIKLCWYCAPNYVTGPIKERLRNAAANILEVVQSLSVIHTVPYITM